MIGNSPRHIQVGVLGEKIAQKYLHSKGYQIIDTNYRKAYGEIDIICRKGNKLNFIEVKSVSRETLPGHVSRETDEYDPVSNVHPWKLKRIGNTILAYLSEKSFIGEWEFSVIAVEVSRETKQARVKMYIDLPIG